MHPAFSVIFFTTMSGLGYGVWIWMSLSLAFWQRGAHSATMHALLLVAAGVPVVLGLLSSTLHLGKPLRAWRAFSQWRTSWLSREGVLAVATFVPFAVLVGGMLLEWPLLDALAPPAAIPAWLLALALGALATVACTAMIYASLKPVPAWRHRSVVPAYLGFALLTGGLASHACIATVDRGGDWAVLAMLLLAVAMVVLKRRYWRDIDRGTLPATRASALGLPADRVASVFERPHTEANYLTKEMGFVVARKHARRLRTIALALFGGVPTLACALVLMWPPLAAPLLAFAAATALAGAFVERWLFFAEAKHLVTLYY